MAVPWYEWKNIRKRLVVFGKALQGISPYKVLIESDNKKCPTGYCNFTRREIAVNPNIFDLAPRDQYQLTKAILVHEAGHRRFTTSKKLLPLTHQVANILEDERIERQMCEEFVGVRWLVKKLSKIFYNESEPINKTSDSPGEVVAYFLQLRWAKRIGLPIKDGLSSKNQKLWQKVKPLVYKAWEAKSSQVVERNAKKIVSILKLEEIEIPKWVKEIMDRLGATEGERAKDDKAERTSGSIHGPETADVDDKEPKPFDGDIPPNDKREGKGYEAIEPKPYIELEEKVKPLVKELIDELSWEEMPCQWEPAERGGRLSLREYLRDKNYPFLTEEDKGKAPPTLALKVIIDHSTSLNRIFSGKTRMESIAEAVMTLHLVCFELGIPHEVLVTPQALKIADIDSGERGKALIAGLTPALCGYEDMGLAIKTYAVPMAEYSQDIKLVLCLTDGNCNDAEIGKKICRTLRGRVEVMGLLLDPDEKTKAYVADMFGQDRLIACRSEELPQKLGNILRAIRGI
ncbi:MAG: hypothetical protein Q8N27_04785 [Candidatus Hydromicrobium sp.]|nr:hypothetical protein [Candidatus Hydromicrobium sp.]